MVFGHGFGCDQSMWRHVAPAFEDRHQVVLFDYVGSGEPTVTDYDLEEYSSLDRFAEDVLSICADLDLRDAIFVGHSVSSVIGILAHIAAPERIGRLVLVGPSVRYIDDGDYVGGFSRSDIEELLELMDANTLGWQQPLAGMVMSGSDAIEVTEELERSFCRTDPAMARRWAEVTFLGDNREDLPRVSAPTLVIQSAVDSIAPVSAGEYVRDHIPDAEMVVIDTVGHCAHLSAPEQTVAAIEEFIDT